MVFFGGMSGQSSGGPRNQRSDVYLMRYVLFTDNYGVLAPPEAHARACIISR